MKGLWIWASEEAVTRRWDERTWDRVLETAGNDGVYTPMGNYPPEDLLHLGDAAGVVLGRPAPEVLDWLGTESLELIAARYPSLVAVHDSPESLIRALGSLIDPNAWRHHNPYVPVFKFEAISPQSMSIYYFPRRSAILCDYIGGVIKGMVQHYGREAVVRQTSCMRLDATHCTFEVGFGQR